MKLLCDAAWSACEAVDVLCDLVEGLCVGVGASCELSRWKWSEGI
ncbi:MAG: hypothetical protein QM790_04355 [Nibricoccus sp.]